MLLVVVVGEAVLVPVTDQTFSVVGILVHFLVVSLLIAKNIYKTEANYL